MSFEPQSAVIVLPYIIYLILGALVLSILVLIAFVFFSASFFKKVFSSRSEIEKHKRIAQKETEAILEKARAEARDINSRVSVKAAEILEAAKLFTSVSEKEIEKNLGALMASERERLQKSAEKFKGAYETLTTDVRQSYLSLAQSLTETMQKESKKTILDFQKNLEEEAVRYRSQTDEKLKEWHMALRQEVDDYRKESLLKVEEAIYRIIGRVAKEVLGEAFDLRLHQKLVLQSLERAKKEGFFHEN